MRDRRARATAQWPKAYGAATKRWTTGPVLIHKYVGVGYPDHAAASVHNIYKCCKPAATRGQKSLRHKANYE